MPLESPVTFTSAARAELIEAQDWYESKVPGLGRRFRTAVDDLIGRISANPHTFPVVYRNIHRGLLNRFPYAVMYILDPDNTVVVIARFHGSRSPKQWQRRV